MSSFQESLYDVWLYLYLLLRYLLTTSCVQCERSLKTARLEKEREAVVGHSTQLFAREQLRRCWTEQLLLNFENTNLRLEVRGNNHAQAASKIERQRLREANSKIEAMQNALLNTKTELVYLKVGIPQLFMNGETEREMRPLIVHAEGNSIPERHDC